MTAGFAISGKENMKNVQIITIRSALKFEVKTGMKMSRVSALQAAQREGLTSKKQKAAALKEVDKYVVDNLGLESVYNEDGSIK